MSFTVETLVPRFGWGGHDPQGVKRPLPVPEDYRLSVTADDLALGKANTLQSGFVTAIARRVFRQSLEEPGFAVITGWESILGSDPGAALREVQINLARQLADIRNQALNLRPGKGFSLKYLGRSNKTKLNPIHCDTKSTDSIILMGYEPSQDIRAYPFIGDLSQYAEDKKRLPESLMHVSGNVKAHYGKQLAAAHHPEVLAHYALDLPELSGNRFSLVVVNDSIGTLSDGRSKLGNVHGVRNLAVTGPNPQRFFNHVVMDVEAHNAGENPDTFSPRNPETDVFYLAKAVPENQRVPVTVRQAIRDYLDDGTVYYRKDSDKPTR